MRSEAVGWWLAAAGPAWLMGAEEGRSRLAAKASSDAAGSLWGHRRGEGELQLAVGEGRGSRGSAVPTARGRRGVGGDAQNELLRGVLLVVASWLEEAGGGRAAARGGRSEVDHVG